MVRSTIRTIVLLLLIWGQTSCIREGLQECEEVYFITIKVVDMLTGEDITASREVSHAILFVFDADEQYRYTVRADSNQVAGRPRTVRYIRAFFLEMIISSFLIGDLPICAIPKKRSSCV